MIHRPGLKYDWTCQHCRPCRHIQSTFVGARSLFSQRLWPILHIKRIGGPSSSLHAMVVQLLYGTSPRLIRSFESLASSSLFNGIHGCAVSPFVKVCGGANIYKRLLCSLRSQLLSYFRVFYTLTWLDELQIYNLRKFSSSC